MGWIGGYPIQTGNGEFVDSYAAPEHPAGVVPGVIDGRNLILEKYDQMFSLIEYLKEDIIEKLDTLQGMSEHDLPDGWEDILRDVTIDEVTPISRSGLPAAPTLDLPDDWPTDAMPILGALKSVPNVDLNYTEPVQPDEPDPTLNWTPGTYISNMWSMLFDKIYDGIENGGVAFSDTVQDAIFDRGRERQRISNAREYENAMDAAGADGFDFAGGAHASVVISTVEEILQQDENLNNDIIKIVADLTQTNKHFMIDKGIAIEGILREFHNLSESRSLEAEQAIAQFVLTKYSEKIKAYIAQWEGVKVGLDAKMKTIDVVLRENELTLKTFESEMQSRSLHIEFIAKKIDAVVSGHKGEVEGYKALVASESAWWNALTQQQKSYLQKNALELERAVKEIAALVESTVSLNGLKERIQEAVANITSQVLASALSAVNSSISHGTSSAERLSESFTHNDSVSESHDFKEK